MIKKIFKRIFSINTLVFLFSTIITLLVAEFLVRTFLPRYNIWDYKVALVQDGFRMSCIPNSTFQHTNQENEYDIEVSINEYGFRDQKDIKASRDKDIILLGDSFSFGYGVAEADRFGNILQSMIPDSVSIYNIANPNCHFLNTKENLNFAKKIGLKGQRMIFGVCMENDLLDYENVKNPSPPSTWKNMKIWLHKNSSLKAFVGDYIDNSEIIQNALGENNNSLFVISDEIIENAVNELVQQIKDYKTLIVIIPDRLIWVEKHQAAVLKTHEKFIRKLKEKSLNVLDLKPFFAARSDNPLKELHFDFDGHWNKEGHQLAAEAIWELSLF